MDRNRLGWLILACGILLGLGSGWGTYAWLETQSEARGGAGLPVHPVVVASRDLGRGMTLKPDDVQVVLFPDMSRPEGALHSIESSIGRIVLEPIRHGEPLLDGKLGPTDMAASPVALRISPHKRAYLIRVDNLAGSVIVPGDRVDLLVTLKPTNSTGSLTEPISRVVVENVPILDVLRAPSEQPATSNGGADSSGEVHGVILEVTPQQAEQVALAEEEGTLRLMFRNPVDAGHVPSQGVSHTNLLDLPRSATRREDTSGHDRPDTVVTPPASVNRTVPPPSKHPPTMHIEVIRGGERSEVVF